ncbi:hypothetical protein KY312_02470, partial [Candidatus Woesearchaeota archaeon]|nr:hypothetical protein [Candidatus Woesearchaeota archaeon]
MAKYQNLFGVHFLENPDVFEGFTAADFSIEKMLGIIVHSCLSARGRCDYNTDGKKIWTETKKIIRPPFSNKHNEDIIRENELCYILDYMPECSSIYEETDGHLRLCNFNRCFSCNNSNEYVSILEEAGRSQPVELIQADEILHIRRRILRKRPEIKRFIQAMKQDEKPMPEYASKLE